MNVSLLGRDLFTYSGGWHELGNLSYQVVQRSASLLREGTMGWAVSLLSLGSCAHLGRLLHLSVPKSMKKKKNHTPQRTISWERTRITRKFPIQILPRHKLFTLLSH